MGKVIKRTTARLHLLTAREVQNANDGDHSDGGGLLLRVRGESATWVFRFTSPNGRRREMGLGAVHRANTQQAGAGLTGARDAAHLAREQLRAGVDPIDARDAEREAHRAADAARKAKRDQDRLTLARCARQYHERVIEPTKTTKHAAQWLSSLENHIPGHLWHKPIADITPPELLTALLAIKPHERARRHQGTTVPETVSRIRQRLDAIFEDASFFRRCTTNPAAAIRSKLQEAMPQRKAGSMRALPYREAPAFMAALRRQPGTAARCLELLLLTAARTVEALELDASELDLDAARWSVPAERMKAGEPHEVFLPPQAVELLRAQLALKLHPCIVFPSPVEPDKALSNMAMLAVLDRMGYRDKTTVHGLRATFSTWANETGAARPDVIEACLAHSESDKIRAAYNRAKFIQERRALLMSWAEYLYAPAARIVPLRAA
jgi:integrase